MNWTDICEKLPEAGVEVLVWVKRDHSECEIAYLVDGKWVTCMRGVGGEEPPVSHWQPLPSQPGKSTISLTNSLT